MLISLLVRLIGINNPLYDLPPWRQTETAAIARNYVTDNLPFLYPEVDWVGAHGHAEMEFPLYAYVISLFYRAFGEAEIWGRLLSILFSLATVLSLWGIGSRLFSRNIGLWAAAFYGLSPMAFYYGRTVQPDSMMVFLSTWSIYALLRWWKESSQLFLYLSAISLSIGCLLKPPCLLVAFPLLWIFYQRDRCTFFRKKEPYIFALIILLPSLFWYSHAKGFYEETGASFMWHFKNFTIADHFGVLFKLTDFWEAIAYRILSQIFVFIGIIPFLLGIFFLFTKFTNAGFLWCWLLGMSMLYLAIPGHHIGHPYYSLLAVPPLAMVIGVGCQKIGEWLQDRLSLSEYWIAILPALIGISGLYMAVNQGWYNNLYFYYWDAVSLQDDIPQDALIAVMDEKLHTPEFFYFIDRNGWHRWRDPHLSIDDSAWVEECKTKGANYLFFLNEASGTNPLHYLQTHTMGTYAWSHYAVESIGSHYSLINLNRPIYGKYLLTSLNEQKIAMPSSHLQWKQHVEESVALEHWVQADVVVLDLHIATDSEIATFNDTYVEMNNDGYRVTLQTNGWIVMQRNPELLPIQNPIQKAQRFSQGTNGSLGTYPPGHYRVSFKINNVPREDVHIQLLDKEQTVLTHRILEDVHWPHIADGERPQLFIHIQKQTEIFVKIATSDPNMAVDSIVVMPDVQCIQIPSHLQAEQLFTVHASALPDEQASQERALKAHTWQPASTVCYGPYFQYPSGQYQAKFRFKRSDHKHNNFKVIYGLRDEESGFSALKEIPSSQLSKNYNTYSIQSQLYDRYAWQVQVQLSSPGTLWIDTISMIQKSRGPLLYSNAPLIFLTLWNGDICGITKEGEIINENKQLIESVQTNGSIKDISNDPILFLDKENTVFNSKNEKIWQVAIPNDEEVLLIASSSSGEYIVVVSSKPTIYTYHEGKVSSYPLDKRAFPIRDVHITNNGQWIILYGDGTLIGSYNNDLLKDLPNFGADVLRKIIAVNDGFYLIDCLGGFHNTSNLNPIKTPYYKSRDWVVDCLRDRDGMWYILSKDGQILSFQEN